MRVVVCSLRLSLRGDDCVADELANEFEIDVRHWIDRGFVGALSYSVYAHVVLTRA